VVDDVVGSGVVEVVEVVDGFGGGGAADETGPVDPSVLNTTILAVFPLGTVTTQKEAPPTPMALTGLSTPPIPLLAGLMPHGIPLQPPPGQSILMPYAGFCLDKPDSSQIGFHATFTYVSPFSTVLAPAT